MSIVRYDDLKWNEKCVVIDKWEAHRKLCDTLGERPDSWVVFRDAFCKDLVKREVERT